MFGGGARGRGAAGRAGRGRAGAGRKGFLPTLDVSFHMEETPRPQSSQRQPACSTLHLSQRRCPNVSGELAQRTWTCEASPPLPLPVCMQRTRVSPALHTVTLPCAAHLPFKQGTSRKDTWAHSAARGRHPSNSMT